MTPEPASATEPSAPRLAAAFAAVRAASCRLVDGLSPEDCQVQSMPDASPLKWHLAHVTWFFETFVLERFEPGFRPFDTAFRVLFNSYYQTVGPQHPRPSRGLVTRPDLARVLAYRAQVDERVGQLLVQRTDDAALAELVTLGLHHEQQHQELMLTDLKHLLWQNPLRPAYARRWPLAPVAPQPLRWIGHDGGWAGIGHDAQRDGAFAFDNEGPRHRVHLAPFEIASRPLSNGEFRVLARSLDGTATGPMTLVVAKNLDDVNESVNILKRSLAVAIPIVTGLLALLVWWLTGRVLRPVESIRREVASIEGHELHRRVPAPESGDEIARLASTSFMFIFVEVPAPPWKASTTNWKRSARTCCPVK